MKVSDYKDAKWPVLKRLPSVGATRHGQAREGTRTSHDSRKSHWGIRALLKLSAEALQKMPGYLNAVYNTTCSNVSPSVPLFNGNEEKSPKSRHQRKNVTILMVFRTSCNARYYSWSCVWKWVGVWKSSFRPYPTILSLLQGSEFQNKEQLW